jgi:integrase
MAGQLGVVEWSLTVEGPKVEPYRDTRGPGTETARLLIEACGLGLKGRRDYAMLLVMLTLGLRRFELAELSVERIDVPGGRVLVKGKGGKWDWVPAPRETLEAIGAWLAAWRQEHGDPPDDRIFRALGGRCIGRPLSPKAVWDIVSALGKKVGVEVWPHGIRHTAVTTFLDLTKGDVRAARVFARHSNVQTTMKYDDNRQDQARVGAEGLAKLFTRKEEER